MTDSRTHSQWMRAAEARTVLDVSDATLRRWANRGFVRTVRTPTNQRRYDRGDVERIARDGVPTEEQASA